MSPPPRRTRTREDPHVRRAMILDEAIRVIGVSGYNGFTIQGLAQRCGLSNAGLLHYFGSKDQLLVGLLEEIERREAEVLGPLVEQAISAAMPEAEARAALHAFLGQIATRFVASPELGRFQIVLQIESMDPAHPAHGWFGERAAMAHNGFARLVARWSAEPEATARQLVAMMIGLSFTWLRTDGAFDLVTEWKKACRALLPGTVD